MANKNAWLSALALLFLMSELSIAEIIVTGSRVGSRDFPAPVSVVNSDEMALAGDVSVDDLINKLPPFQSTGQPTRIVIRGGGDGSGGNAGIDVLVNGRSVPGYVETEVGRIPMEFIQRVEVIKGEGAASMYGAEAVAGVVNLVTRSDYEGFDVRGSSTLPYLQQDLGNFWISMQSQEYCDSTNGALTKPFALFNSWNYGLEKYSPNGKSTFFGSVDRGFKPNDSNFIPSAEYQDPFASFFGTPSTQPFLGLPYDRSKTFKRLRELDGRVRSDPSLSADDRTSYYKRFLFGAALGGTDAFSDQAWEFGHFDPDKFLQDLKADSANQAATNEPASGTTAPSVVDRIDGLNVPDDTIAGGGQPAGKPDVAKDPFAQNAYPADYNFDLAQCSDDESEKILQLIWERDAARGHMVHFMGQWRNRYRSAEQVKNDEDGLAKARATRDEKNNELRSLWQSCTKPKQTSTADAVASQSSTSTADTEACFPRGVQQPNRNRMVFGEAPFGVRFEVHVEETVEGDDGVFYARPVPDFAVGLHYTNYGDLWDVPFGKGSLRCPDRDAGAGSNKRYTTQDGIAAFELPAGPLGWAVGYEYRQETFTYVPDSASAQDAPVTSSLKRDADEMDVDWNIGIGYEAADNFTIGVKYKHRKSEQVVQVFPGLGGSGIDNLPADVWSSIPVEFKNSAGTGSSIGNDWWQTYRYAEDNPLDLNFMNTFSKQGGWLNDQCGETALPPESVGYLPADQSPVKSVDDQWALENVGVAKGASLLTGNAQPVIVGIIDTGLDWNHLDFAWDNLWRNDDEIPDNGIDDDNNGYVDDLIGWDFFADHNKPWDNDGHGTFVAGIVAATQGNAAGIDGINPNAKIMVLKAVNNFGLTRASYVARAIVYGADNGASILNLSITGPGFPKIVQDAVDYAESKGVLVIIAAGNRAEDIDNALPNRLKRVMAVAATGPGNKRAAFSNVGSAINIAAPGVDIVSLRARGTDFMYNSAETTYIPGDAFLGDDRRYYRSTGTSFAAPVVSGIASLVWANRPELTLAQVRRVLEQSARDVETPGRDRFTGYGIVDAKAALAADPEFYIHAIMPTVQPVMQDDRLVMVALGVADADQFARASLEIGRGEDPQSWTNTGKIVEPIQFGELGRIPVAEFEGSSVWTIRLLVEHRNGRKREMRYVVDVQNRGT